MMTWHVFSFYNTKGVTVRGPSGTATCELSWWQNGDTVELPSRWALPGVRMVARWGRGRVGAQGGAVAQRNRTMALGFGWVARWQSLPSPITGLTWRRKTEKGNGEREEGSEVPAWSSLWTRVRRGEAGMACTPRDGPVLNRSATMFDWTFWNRLNQSSDDWLIATLWSPITPNLGRFGVSRS
jgi:hypothetical protein